ncbi:MAG TPA: type II toxin-antitoxin system mRNA interferase toxin, RelE/StbE family, partial [Synechococcus sp. UBA8638]|nr:type II toxin-antitoxin system mRNA interferase toxin, RelE/StbE family [Synechococcus sp. UBA8638]
MKPEKPLYLDAAKQFKKDVSLCKKQNKDLDKLWDIVEILRNREPLDPKHKKHPLSGRYKGSWECHIKPDWLLIWDVAGDALRLIRTGS